jgi:hypothetical protein
MRRIAWLLFAAIFVSAAPARASSEPAPTLTPSAPVRNMDRVRPTGESPRVVRITRFVGLPADSASRGLFLQAFHAAMDAETWPCEARDGELWTGPKMHPNLFRLIDAAPAEESWALDVSLRLPPQVRVARKDPSPNSSLPPPRARVSHVRSSRGLTIAVTVTAPRISPDVVSSDPAVFSIYFPDARRILVPTPNLPSGGYAYPWADAGRVVALAMLEALHRASRGITADERATLAPASRMDPAGAEVVP